MGASTHAEGPVALFNHAVTWLRKNRVLLPGVSVVARHVPEAVLPRIDLPDLLFEVHSRTGFLDVVKASGPGPGQGLCPFGDPDAAEDTDGGA